MKTCPQCGRLMSIGSPHDERWSGQWECPGCGFIEGIPLLCDTCSQPLGYPDPPDQRVCNDCQATEAAWR
ncbi:hypothetical protein LCGC14_0998880 [marine sediment metagenome]|uniref:Uncharacterized protein n=1 Tax=marine sediment metagenome TaxID=412755 RepID=A0A0F9N8D0_9ZZZZ